MLWQQPDDAPYTHHRDTTVICWLMQVSYMHMFTLQFTLGVFTGTIHPSQVYWMSEWIFVWSKYMYGHSIRLKWVNTTFQHEYVKIFRLGLISCLKFIQIWLLQIWLLQYPLLFPVIKSCKALISSAINTRYIASVIDLIFEVFWYLSLLHFIFHRVTMHRVIASHLWHTVLMAFMQYIILRTTCQAMLCVP